MPIDPLLSEVRARWTSWARVPVSFPPAGPPSVAVSPESGLCPPGWVGVVALGGSAIATAPDERAAALVRDALARLPPAAVTDPAAVRRALPVAELLGPAALAYLAAARFRPVGAGAPAVERLPARHDALRELAESAGPQEAGEADVGGVTSPAFVVSEAGRVVAAAGYQLWPGRVAHVSVLTDPGWRGRGLARATGAAAVAHALAAGLLPQWRARPPASRRVAAALGFEELGAQLSVRLAE
ncbi:GNAT family N-acetyltransferase [Streptomyces sp. 3MP-14]|uniref:GNAT family N-acetyltransferase n=1 Tax=Streptomyces mimosae TaxID=2586635 RepID=A0A5N5ZWH5_9ACTN|nr:MULTISPECIES: GNAT family N-acetyltransferase [Streptomyces]KAB8160252.1 GNAT family N-acetyltransferase [Streptomyces mimosae]KAB8172986.1 GNAT family N-acetyltransferase [Streptomyces sp. 3MP-14]